MNSEEWAAYEASWCDGNGRRDSAARRPVVPVQVGSPMGWVEWSQPVVPHGCPRCCPACNLHVHSCPGCGAGLEHGVGICLRCRQAMIKMAEAPPAVGPPC